MRFRGAIIGAAPAMIGVGAEEFESVMSTPPVTLEDGRIRANVYRVPAVKSEPSR